jgi:hypothetical protein
MSEIGNLGLARGHLDRQEASAIEYVIVQRALDRILAFTGRTIDDVINDPIARRQVAGYYRLYRQVQRGCETVDLERWWNGLASMPPRP